jgi:UDP-N-acetylmuramoylalanine--D-glutamate ligase
MIASILRAAGRNVFLGGNIGGSLLDDLPKIQPDDWVVLEMSSFQLWHFSHGGRMPHIAVATGCTPNHLDWHDDFQQYVEAKQRLFSGQTSEDFAVLNVHDPEVATWGNKVSGRLLPLPLLADLPPLPVPGEHNRVDAACAAAAALGAGCDFDVVQRGLQNYCALPQRLERVAVIDGRHFFNDSTATTPESTIAALQALDMPIWLMAGGKNKGFDFLPMANAIVRYAKGAVFFGACRKEIYEATVRQLPARRSAMQPSTICELTIPQSLGRKSSDFPCVTVETMAEALQWCRERAESGEAILLSPGCASTDQFRNFRERGERFVELVQHT